MAVIDKDDSLLIARSGRWGSGPCLPHHPVTVESDRCSLGRPVCKQACFPGKGLARRRCYLGHPPWRSSHSPGNRAGPMIPKKVPNPAPPAPILPKHCPPVPSRHLPPGLFHPQVSLWPGHLLSGLTPGVSAEMSPHPSHPRLLVKGPHADTPAGLPPALFVFITFNHKL